VVKLKSTEKNVFGGDWSLRKLECVANYLNAYLDVFKNMDWSALWYIDAFCGSGFQGIDRCRDADVDNEEARIEFVEGSAIRALRVASNRDRVSQKSFDHFVFIECDAHKIDELKQYVGESFPDQYPKCQFICADANDALPDCIGKMNWVSDRGVAFLDPCSLQLEWKTMECFRGTCIDVWCLFPIEAICRMLPNKHMPDESWTPKLNTVFGNNEWQSVYSQPRINQLPLFGEADDSFERNHGIDEILDYVKGRYRSIFPEVMDPAILRGEKNSPLFALFPLIANESKKARAIAARISEHLVRSINKT
jgi:three-Cys-motif partner protein